MSGRMEDALVSGGLRVEVLPRSSVCRLHVSAFNAVLMTIAASAPSPTPATTCCLGLRTPLNDSVRCTLAVP
jgi:hypothetical protein